MRRVVVRPDAFPAHAFTWRQRLNSTAKIMTYSSRWIPTDVRKEDSCGCAPPISTYLHSTRPSSPRNGKNGDCLFRDGNRTTARKRLLLYSLVFATPSGFVTKGLYKSRMARTPWSVMGELPMHIADRRWREGCNNRRVIVLGESRLRNSWKLLLTCARDGGAKVWSHEKV